MPTLLTLNLRLFFKVKLSFVDVQDAKEHLSALADQLGPSLVDIEVR